MKFFALIFILSFLTSSGGFESGDALTRFETAKSIARGEDGSFVSAVPLNGAVLIHGKHFSNFGILQPLCMVPFVLFSKMFPPDKEEWVARVLISLFLVPLITALGITILKFALSEWRVPRAGLVALLFFAATPIWYYGRTAQEENFLVLAYSVWLLAMAKLTRHVKGALWLASLGGILALTARWASLAVLVVLLLATLWYALEAKRLFTWEMVGSALGCLLMVGLLGNYNLYRFGSVLETGYSLNLNQHQISFLTFQNFGSRLLALLFSPYRGIFLFAPILWIGIWRFKRTSEKFSRIEGIGLVGFMSALLLNSLYYQWSAGYSWGPRFLVGAMVLLGPTIGRSLQIAGKKACWIFCSVSIFLQILSTLIPPAAEEWVREERGILSNDLKAAWSLELSPLVLRPVHAWGAISNTLSVQNMKTLMVGTKPSQVHRESSDYQTVFWWPFRFSIRFGLYPWGAAWVIFFILVALSMICVPVVFKA